MKLETILTSINATKAFFIQVLAFSKSWRSFSLKSQPLVHSKRGVNAHLKRTKNIEISFLAHLSRRLIGELIVYPCSGVRRRCRRRRCPPFSNVFSSETAWQIKAKFYVEPPWEGGTKVYINGPGHMTKMAAIPIYGKNLKKSSSPEPAGRFPRNLVCSIGDSCPS